MSSRPPGGFHPARSGQLLAVALTALLVLLGTAAGAVWGWHGSAEHRAAAMILVNPLEGSPFSPEGQGDDLVNLQTEAELVTSDSVTGIVARRLGIAAPIEQVRAGVSVTVPTNTQLLRVRATDPSTAVAMRRAQAFAEAYLDFRQSRTESLVFDRNARLNEQLQQLSAELTKLSQQLSREAPRSARGLLLQQQVVELTNRIGNLHTQLVASQATSTDAGQVVTPAAGVRRGPLAGPARSGAAGGAAGLLLAGVIMIGRTRFSRTVRDPADLDDVGVPVLPHGDGLAGVRARVLGLVDRRPLVVQVATSSPSFARPVTAGGLGLAFGRANLETVLVDVSECARADERAGLTDLLLDRIAPDEALEPSAANLELLPPGVDSSRLDDLLAGTEMTDVLTELRKRADVVLLSGGPIAGGRMQAVSRLCDVTLLEVIERRTTLADVEDAVRDVEQSGGHLGGLIYVSSPRWPRWSRPTRRRV